MDSIRYLSDEEIKTFHMSQGNLRDAIIRAFAAYGRGQAQVLPAAHIDVTPGRGFRSLCASWEASGYASNKWFGITPVEAGAQRPGIHALLVLNDFQTGQPVALMGANQITGWRTASMSAAVASYFANPDATTLGFVGCGLQASMHLDAFREILPRIESVLACSRSFESAQRFVRGLAARGLIGRALESPEEVVRQSQVLVTSVPLSEGLRPFLDPGWLGPGTFVAAVDLARSWLPSDLHQLEVRITDDHVQQATLPPISPDLGAVGTFSCDLAELTSGQFQGNFSPSQRAMFIFRGSGLADLAIAAEVYRYAQRRGLGLQLPR